MKINWKKLIIIIAITFIVGGFFSFLTMSNMSTFKALNKPIDVPGFIFPIVWSILYILMSISLYIVLSSTNKVIIPYAIQLVINSLWTLIFFGLKNYLFAFIWLLILLISIIYMLFVFYKINKKAVLLNIPYVLWVIFAGYLNLGIYLLNR